MIDKTEKRWQAMYYELAKDYAILEAKYNRVNANPMMYNEEEINRLAIEVYNGIHDQRKAADK